MPTPDPTEHPIVDGDGVRWTFDQDFLTSRWVCIWDRGCLGVEAEAAPELGRGCCSQGAELHDDDELLNVSALAATLTPAQFQFFDDAADGGIVGPDRNEYGRRQTRRVEGACIFLNRPGFAGGAGCALHHGAVAFDESPLDWKPSVCWQLPLRVDHTVDAAGVEHARVRRWSRADWGPDGESMAWCCTDVDPQSTALADAYVGDLPVIDSLAAELDGVAGTEVMVELRRRYRQPS